MKDLFAFLDRWEAAVPQAVAEALNAEAGAVTNAAQQAGGYQDQTGAARTGTVAYVPGMSDAQFDRAVANVEQLNPGHAVSETVGSVDSDEVVLVITMATDYADELETRQGGASASLGPTLQRVQGQLTQSVASHLARLLK